MGYTPHTMTAEWTFPTPQEILDGIFQAERTGEEVMNILGLVDKGIKEGEVRTTIGCLDNVRAFFEMANRMYVQNDAEIVLTDAELGIHQIQCESPICRKLSRVYFEVLRPSKESDSVKISKQLQELAVDIILGKPRKDLEGRKSMFFDSQSGTDLFEIKVVDITDKCIVDKRMDEMMRRATGAEREVLLCYVPYSGGMMCDIKENYGGSGMSQAFNATRMLSPDEQYAFERRASIIGIDSELFQAIIAANAPREKLLK